MGTLHLDIIGKKFTNNKGYVAKVIDYKGNRAVTIKFAKPYTNIITVRLSDLNLGNFKNYMAPSVYGVGITGNEKINKVWYKKWHNMIRRCYDVESLKKYPSYLQCKVCNEWLYFPNFVIWCEKQKYEKSWALDKDWLHPKNKIYAPDNCVFVPQELNNFFANRSNNGRGLYAVGVSLVQKSGLFVAHIFKNGKLFNLGVYATEQKAHKIYVLNKEAYAKELAFLHKNVIPNKLYKAIKKYTVLEYTNGY